MPSILELSNEGKFNIKAVSRITGIPPVTMRAWERRYRVLDPNRAENGYRRYSERDIAILSWLKQQVDSGISISNVANEFLVNTRLGIWPESEIKALLPIKINHSTVPPSDFSKRLYNALTNHDEQTASELLSQTLNSFELVELFENVLTPTLVKIGEAWYEGRILVATEHFASGFFRAKIQTIFQNLPLPHNKHRIIIGGAPGELHEIGSMMVATLLREAGYRVEFLGPDIPLDDLFLYARSEHPHMIILSATLRESTVDLAQFQEQLKELHPTPFFGYGGAAFNLNPDLVSKTPGIFLGKTLTQTVESVRSLLDPKKQE
jgi:methanogenic corrinoid protein MtbC1